MGAVRKIGKSLDPTTSAGLTNIATIVGTGGIAALPALAGGKTPAEGFDQFGRFAKDKFLGGDEEEAALLQEEAAVRAQELAGGRFEQIVTPGLEIGQQAQQRQAALSGALGPEAQAAAFEGFQESPGTSFLREQGLRQLESTGVSGGNRLRALTEFSQGLALQNLQSQQQQLGQVAGQGISLAGTGATLTGLETGGITAEGAAQAAGQVAQGQAIANLIEQGVGAATAFSGAGGGA